METLKTIVESSIDGDPEAERDVKKLKTGEETEWKGVIVGIDLGMSHSRIGLHCDDQMKFTVEIPSCVAFTDNGVLVGEEAMEHAIDNPTNTIFIEEQDEVAQAEASGRRGRDPSRSYYPVDRIWRIFR